MDSNIYNSELNYSLKILKDCITDIRQIIFEKKVLCLLHTMRCLEYAMHSALIRAQICLHQAKDPCLKKEIVHICTNMNDLQMEFGSNVINGSYGEKKEKIASLIENSLCLLASSQERI